MPRDLSQRVIVITGGGSGIGAATAMVCAQAGMKVVVAGRRMDKLAAVAAAIDAMGGRALPVTCDVDRDADVTALLQRTMDAFGRWDVAFANAGYGLYAPIMETSDQQMRAIFETNLHGTLRLVRAAVPIMRRAGAGHVLICSSAASEISPPFYGAYAATKAAQDSIAGALRAELWHERIYVTSVHPIGTRTEFFENVQRGEGRERLHLNTPGPLRQTPQRVARAIMRCLRQRHPAPEVWPHTPTRWGLACATACPRLSAWALRRFARGLVSTPAPASQRSSAHE